MIVSLTGTLAEVQPTLVVLDVGGVGYEMGVSTTTSSALPAVGTTGITLLTRLVVREGAVDLYGFGSAEERMLFDRLTAISHVGPKLALSVLSTFTPSGLATVVATNDATRMATVPGVGKKTATRLILELADVLAKDPSLRSLVGAEPPAAAPDASAPTPTVDADVMDALLSMGFTSQEAELALEGHAKAGAQTVEAALAYALRRLGGRS